ARGDREGPAGGHLQGVADLTRRGVSSEGAMSSEKRVVELGRSNVERQVSAFELERYHAGELDADRRRAVEALLASDAALAAELDELRGRDAAFRVQMPFERFLADHDARVEAASGPARVRTWLRELRWSLG